MEVFPQSDERLARLRARLADRFEFLALLGQGGGGAVFEVRNLRLDRIEGLKVLANALEELGAQRFEHEARILASLDHPRIVKVYEFGQDAGLPWYSMQYVDGPSLGALMDAGFPLDLPQVAGIVMPILDALAYSHAKGVVHRDIKPANILLNREGRPFLSDFGIAKSRESVHQTRTGQLLGTPAYVAPEQALGEPVDARVDQYSLAITIYRILAGRLPFSSDNVLQTVVQRLKEAPAPIQSHRRELPDEVAAVVMRGLEIDRNRRWPDILAMREAFSQAFQEAGVTWHEPLAGLGDFPLARRPLDPSSLPQLESQPPGDHAGFAQTVDLPTRRRTRRRKQAAALVGVALALGAGGLAWRVSRPAAQVLPASPDKPAETPRAPAPSTDPDRAPRPSAGPRGQEAPPPATPPPRRPVTYPEQVGGPGPVQSPVGCGGLSAPVSLLVGEDGRVKSCRILKEVPAACRKAVEELAMSLTFRPALDDKGQPVQATVGIAVTLPEAP
ncbi:MAG: protein kinase [Acidobacteria bacterium]|nr:protein kinase [Acidobacteriota bacterium]